MPEKLNAEGRETLQRLGVLNENGKETMFGSLVFPLVDAASQKTVNFYARHLSRKQHLYLSGELRGLFNPNAAANADEIIVAESVIDALALWSLGFRSVLPTYGTNGLTNDILDHLSESRITKAVLMLDSDDAGREAAKAMAARLSEIGVETRTVELPAKDASEFVTGGGTAEQISELLSGATANVEKNETLETLPELETL